VMYAVLDSIVDSFIPVVGALVSDAAALDQLALSLEMNDQNDFLERIRIARSKLAKVRTTLLVKREIMNQLTARGYTTFVKQLTKIYLADVADELDQQLSKCDVASSALSGFPSTFLARLSVESSSVSNRLNDLMKKYSAVALILLPMTLVAGVFGMNVQVFGQADIEEDNYFFFGSICGSLALFGLLLAVFFYKIRWL
jgi:Mg2+ and Co2+ transporter CorA